MHTSKFGDNFRYLFIEIRDLLKGDGTFNGVVVSPALIRMYKAMQLLPMSGAATPGKAAAMGSWQGGEFEAELWRLSLWYGIVDLEPSTPKSGRCRLQESGRQLLM